VLTPGSSRCPEVDSGRAASKIGYVCRDLRELLAGVESQVGSGGPPVVSPARARSSNRDAELHMAVFVLRLNAEVALDGLPGSESVPTTPVLSEVGEETRQILESRRVPVDDPSSRAQTAGSKLCKNIFGGMPVSILCHQA
jgi:hypothetical protein